jgi:putative ABC transport system permease protein
VSARDLLVETLRSLRAHALRFSLTGLGIAWGALMLTYLTSSMAGTERHFRDQVRAGGERALYVMPGRLLDSHVGERGTRPVEIDRDDLPRLDALQGLERVSPNVRLWNRLARADRRTKLLNVTGVDASLFAIRSFEIERGRFFTPAEVAQGARVVVLASGAKQRLFGREPAVGRSVSIDGVRFRVLGVTRAKGQIIGFGGVDDQQTFVPYTTAGRWLTRTDELDQLVVEPPRLSQTDAAIAAIRVLVGLHHGFDPGAETALQFVSTKQVWAILDRIFIGFRIFLLATGLVTLLVGAVGVMNIMLVVVGERRREIGLRKAVGAADRDVFRLFLAEATAVAVTSGLLGTLLGWALVQLRARTAPSGDALFATPLFEPWIAAGVAISLVGVAVVAGALPAWRASRMAPAESLRASQG